MKKKKSPYNNNLGIHLEKEIDDKLKQYSKILCLGDSGCVLARWLISSGLWKLDVAFRLNHLEEWKLRNSMFNPERWMSKNQDPDATRLLDDFRSNDREFQINRTIYLKNYEEAKDEKRIQAIYEEA